MQTDGFSSDHYQANISNVYSKEWDIVLFHDHFSSMSKWLLMPHLSGTPSHTSQNTSFFYLTEREKRRENVSMSLSDGQNKLHLQDPNYIV